MVAEGEKSGWGTARRNAGWKVVQDGKKTQNENSSGGCSSSRCDLACGYFGRVAPTRKIGNDKVYANKRQLPKLSS